MNTKKELRVFFIPITATGHMLPMANLAALFACRPGVEATMVMTPARVTVVRSIIDRSVACGSPVKLLTHPYPSEAVGLQPGQEDLDSASDSPETRMNRSLAVMELSRGPLDSLLRQHRPDVVVVDMFHWHAASVVGELGIPRITFHAIGAYPHCILRALNTPEYSDQSEVVTIPGLPEPEMKIPRSELPDFIQVVTDAQRRFWDMLYELQMQSYGVVVNTFYELEPAYCDHYRKTSCQRAWFVPKLLDPASANTSKAEGGVAEENDNTAIMEWLDQQRDGSVVYISLGSWCTFDEEQMREMAHGLESSGAHFLWVVIDLVEWTGPDGWEERMRVNGMGMVVRRWAPQVAILGHPAVGAFLTHCGWNALMEAVVAGVPVLTWPIAVEQFLNERVLVDLAGIGERVVPDGPRATKAEDKVLVPREVIAKAVSRFMDEGFWKYGRVREQARKYAEMAKAAIKEGGSAYNDLNRMIDELIQDLAHGGTEQNDTATAPLPLPLPLPLK